ncbi:MAG: hypothetical protein AAGA57_09775 [Planctomycetota bacterium]
MTTQFTANPWFWLCLLGALAASYPRARRAARKRAAGPDAPPGEPPSKLATWLGTVAAGLCAALAVLITRNPWAGMVVVVSTLAGFAAMVILTPDNDR